MSYYRFISPETAEEYGSFHVEYIASDPYLEPGWYWYACLPGCLPDGEHMGPFRTQAEAIENAREA